MSCYNRRLELPLGSCTWCTRLRKVANRFPVNLRELLLKQSYDLLSWEGSMLSKTELQLLAIFRRFQVGPSQMLCFNSQQLKTHKKAFEILMEKGYLVRETFGGAFSLTRDGFAAMKNSM